MAAACEAPAVMMQKTFILKKINVWNINEAAKRGGVKCASLSLARMYIDSTSLSPAIKPPLLAVSLIFLLSAVFLLVRIDVALTIFDCDIRAFH